MVNITVTHLRRRRGSEKMRVQRGRFVADILYKRERDPDAPEYHVTIYRAEPTQDRALITFDSGTLEDAATRAERELAILAKNDPQPRRAS